ncbi:MAG: outer membrane beta-barrel protein [Bacteroidetes bacterium]|nr:outer membrane beta-barrel protein [Bacteroidota bacterium]
MKTKIIFSAIAALLFFNANAQSSYAGANFTYGFPIAGTALGTISTSNFSSNTGSYENVKGSFGTGFNVGSYFGYSMNSNLGFEIGVNYLWGKKYNFEDNRDYGSGSYDNVKDEVYASSFRISPAFRIGFEQGKFHPYMRAGMTFGLFNKIVDNTTETSKGPLTLGADICESRFEFSKGNSIGFTGAIGVNYSISGNMYLFAEITNYLMSWAPQKGELLKNNLNGNDQLPTINVSDKQFEFVDHYDRTATIDTNAPTPSLKHYFPMSSLGVTIGMHFDFGK